MDQDHAGQPRTHQVLQKYKRDLERLGEDLLTGGVSDVDRIAGLAVANAAAIRDMLALIGYLEEQINSYDA